MILVRSISWIRSLVRKDRKEKGACSGPSARRPSITFRMTTDLRGRFDSKKVLVIRSDINACLSQIPPMHTQYSIMNPVECEVYPSKDDG